jgi:hypothetical protein
MGAGSEWKNDDRSWTTGNVEEAKGRPEARQPKFRRDFEDRGARSTLLDPMGTLYRVA